MTDILIPPSLVSEARKLGVEIDPRIRYSPEEPLIRLSQQYDGIDPMFGAEDCTFEADVSDFGGLFSKLKKTIKKVGKGVGKVAKAGLKVGAVASFVVPGVGPLVGGSALAAMSAADKVLGGTKKKKAATIVNNTKAMAALGDPAARRGAAVLATVSQIRVKKAVPQGKKAIPAPIPPKITRYVKMVPKVQATVLAAKKVEQAKTATRKSFWIRLKELFKPPAVTVGCDS